MKKRKFEITTDIKMLWIADEKEFDEICKKHADMTKIIDILNKLYKTKIKNIIRVVKDDARLGYDIFYNEGEVINVD